jgi:large subunit ribosomal protein L29
MTAASELVLMDPTELETRLDESRKELFNLRFQLATGQLDNSARVKDVRREVARILTVLRDREIQEAEGTYVPPVTTRRAVRVAAARAAEDAEADELVDADEAETVDDEPEEEA